MSQKYLDYLKTDYWKAVSDAVKKRDGYRCRMCNSPHDLAAHHRTYEHREREMEFLGDLTCVCRRCHEIFHGKVTIAPPIEAQVPAVTKAGLSKRQRRALREKVRCEMTNVRPHTQAEIDAEMPDGDPIVLSREILSRCRTHGAFTTSTIEALNVASKMTRGWVDRLCGTEMPREQFRRALEGKYIYASAVFPKI